jgi:hypothetical protein
VTDSVDQAGPPEASKASADSPPTSADPPPPMTALIERQQSEAEAEWVAGWLAGPTRLRWESLPVQVGDPAPDLSLLDANGAPVDLSALWAAGPTLLLFLRHYGCSCLAERWDSLRD